ncbi:MAG: hypothetical protein KF782_06270 [Labilithrix sp.]|nr:hypothetical protein [Labilithrix sp.]
MTDSPRVGGWTLEAKRGEGAGGIVFRAVRSDGIPGALKIARAGDGVGREALVLARAQRRWGPTLIEAGRLERELAGPDGSALPRGASWMATTWVDGDALDARLARPCTDEERRALAAIVAHGVGRGLDELHRGGVRHGDVKPANVLLAPARPAVDRARDRGATLVDLDLATEIAHGSLEGGTPRYLAPELRAGEAPGPAADLYALGLVLAEILVPSLARAPALDAAAVVEALGAVVKEARDVAAWTAALLARAPGARPSAAWIADRAARALRLDVDLDEVDRGSPGSGAARVRRRSARPRRARCTAGRRDRRPRARLAGRRARGRAAFGRGSERAGDPPLDALSRRGGSTPDRTGGGGVTRARGGRRALAARLLALAAIAPPEMDARRRDGAERRRSRAGRAGARRLAGRATIRRGSSS